nr:Holliday junction branch migration DNA helicase RuvB [Candidatus Omnitrophota bacterium]
IVDVVEPYLLKTGFLRRTARGRELTEDALKHIRTGATPAGVQKN